MNLIEINELSYSYPTLKDALKNVNLQIEEGKFICIVGENGSGKSTLLKCIVGLNKGYDGKITINDKIGYLPQKTEIQSNFPASIEEVVLSGTISQNIKKILYTREDKERAKQVMQDLGIYDIKRECFRDLSGGQQQRVLIARALCATDKIIILDEPTNGLDPNIANQIYNMLKKLNKEQGLTILMVSHDVDRAIKYCTNVVKIVKGKVIFNGKTEDYKIEGGMQND